MLPAWVMAAVVIIFECCGLAPSCAIFTIRTDSLTMTSHNGSLSALLKGERPGIDPEISPRILSRKVGSLIAVI
jgi:hypothetical protein